MKKIFIDGQAGTTGLEIKEKLNRKKGIELLQIADEDRKNSSIKKELINSADLVVLCLPDEAAKESVNLLENEKTKFLDASTAHRVHPNWVYGIPELEPNQRKKIEEARLVSNPGCYPTGFLLAIKPLISGQLLDAEEKVSVNAVSGYSGGGRKLIDNYIDLNNKPSWNYRPYGLSLSHKHLPEMKRYSGLENNPIFTPAVSNFERGMLVNIPLHNQQFNKKANPELIKNIWKEFYKDEAFIRVIESPDQELEENFLNPLLNNHTNRVDLMVFGHEEQCLLVARLDNLGKGASGAAIQNLNLMLGFPENEGLTNE